MSKEIIIGWIKRDNGIDGPGYAEWEEPVYSASPAAERIAELQAKLDASEQENAAWREYYIATALLDGLELDDPAHGAAILRVVKATEALKPMATGELSEELKNTCRWIQQQRDASEQREAELRRVVEAMLKSAHPHPTENPAMFAAWKQP